uniref:Uncharacterized protein n=1 Tax=Cucumis melo subsp. melo TaxID=412675 RepID=E5GCP9_CUCME|nr:hypothetical protein [Cucumis melo subsp. melo]
MFRLSTSPNFLTSLSFAPFLNHFFKNVMNNALKTNLWMPLQLRRRGTTTIAISLFAGYQSRGR